MCDPSIHELLKEQTYRLQLLNLLPHLRDHLQFCLDHEDNEGWKDKIHIDVIIIGHGRIDRSFIPASSLTPSMDICDTILYSPWNCSLNGDAVCGIASGLIRLSDRQFYLNNVRARQPARVIPNTPRNWNSMRCSQTRVPLITLSPVRRSESGWARFEFLFRGGRLWRDGRVIIPLLYEHPSLQDVPLFMIILTLASLCMIGGMSATVHLGACLASDPQRPQNRAEWAAQYAYTEDNAVMSINSMDIDMDSDLVGVFRQMFG